MSIGPNFRFPEDVSALRDHFSIMFPDVRQDIAARLDDPMYTSRLR